jgi:hypothetical protein
MTAGVLHNLGVDMGHDITGPSRANPLGYFEDATFHALTTAILNAAGGDRHTLPDSAQIAAQREDFHHRIRAAVRERSRPLWGWKDPMAAFTLPLFLDAVEAPHFVVCHRPLHDVALSYQRMVGLPLDEVTRLVRQIEAQVRAVCTRYADVPRIHVHHRSFLQAPEAHTAALARFLDLEAPPRTLREASRHIKPKSAIRVLQVRKMVEKGISDPAELPRYLVRQVGILAGRARKALRRTR